MSQSVAEIVAERRANIETARNVTLQIPADNTGTLEFAKLRSNFVLLADQAIFLLDLIERLDAELTLIRQTNSRMLVTLMEHNGHE